MTVQVPMLAVPSRTVAPTPESTVAKLHARGDYLWQPKWDGIRAFAYVEDGTARLINSLGVDISDRYPDVIAALADAYPLGRDHLLPKHEPAGTGASGR